MLFFKRLTLFISSLAILFTVTGGVLAPVNVTHAQLDGLEEVGDTSGLQDESLQVIIARIIRTFLTVLGIIAVVIVIYGGFVWMTASGDADKVDRAKKILINGFIGLAIILLSWSITTFVLNALLDATGGSSGSSSSSSSSGSSSYGGGSTTTFAVASYSPEGEISIRNVVAKVTFSRTLDEETVEGNIVITNTETGEEVDGTLEVSGNRVSFTPSEPCPEPNEDRYCFDENTQYTVTVDSDIESSSGTSLNCSSSECTSTFTTGELIDTEDPEASVTYPESGENISTDSSSLVQVSATDDSEVSTADFYAGDDWFDTVAASGDDLSDVTIESTWYTDDTEEDTRYTLEVTVTDIAGNEDTDSVRIRILPAHCFNGEQDEDEEGEDCGGSCGSCDGDSCEEDSDCSSGTCEDGTCVSYPEIESISPSNGAVGTYVTISGSGFGSSGSIYFSDGAGSTVEADIPSCGDGWTSDEIVAEVPEGAGDGPITIEVSSTGYSDSTDDDSGALIDDFDVNDTERPSLCDIAPDTDEVGSAVTFSGIGFGDSQGDSFISFDTSEGSSYSSWSDSAVVVTVPSLTAGEYVDVSITVDGVTSNELSFGVDYSDDEVPTIYSIDPEDGGLGQYVTISGTNFGSSLGSVWFEDQTTGYVAQGSVDFPSECDGDTWGDDEITIIVPEEFTNEESVTTGDYNLYITTQAGVDSEETDFEVTDEDPSPGICAISPESGDVGDTVVIYGERLGSTSGSVAFYSSVAATVDDWDDESVTVTVPTGAATGEVTVTSSADDESNGINFEVGSTDSEETSSVSGGYAWYFSTGEIPEVPTILEECSDDLVSAVPNSRFTSDACTNAIVRATFSTLMEESTIDEDTVLVFECEDSDCDIDYEDETPISATVSASSSTSQTSFSWIASSDYNGGAFKISTSYLVVVTDDAAADSSVGGQTLAEDESWEFTTSASATDCDVEEVQVSPTSDTLEEEGEESEFNALPLQECQVLNPESYDWDWDTDTDSYIGLTDCDDISESYCITATAAAEGTTTLTAEEMDSGTEGDAEVIVNFTDPYVSDYQPNCSSACINGEINLSFNTTMDSSVTDDVALYVCSNELCTSLTEITTTAACTGIEDDEVVCSEVTLTIADTDYGTTLDEGEFYRVILSGSAISQSGVALTRTNYGDDYSWTFGTKSSNGLCLVSSIALSPENEMVEAIGDTQYYEVKAYGDPDACSVAGQELNTYSYSWDWTDPIIDDEDVAEWVTIGSSLFDVGQSNIPSGCTSSCLASGSESYYGICGNGSVETGEDCDEGDLEDGDGCSSSCLNEGTDACTYSCVLTGESCTADSDCQETCEITDTETLTGTCSLSGDECSADEDCAYGADTCDADSSSCCGDGDIDDYEECDDGNSADGDGCSSSCLNEGSNAVDATCGNSDVAYAADQGGEECDDGNAASGDGCSNICLNEGTTMETEIGAECGNGTIEPPYETCDDENTTDGDGCSSSCVREGADATYSEFGSSGECGDETLDQNATTGAGEDCDGEEYCSDDCTLSGSSLYYSVPSVCGDGYAGYGELSACEDTTAGAGSDGNIDPLQLAQISTDAGVQVDPDTNLATATIEVEYEDLSAYTSLYLSCVAELEDDSDCPTGYGPSSQTKCCMERPDPDLFPNGSNACLNAELYGVFNMEMDTGTFEDNVYVELDVSTTDDGACPSTHTEVALGHGNETWWQRLLHIFTMVVTPVAHAQTSGDCIVPLTGFTQTSLGDGTYKVTFNHDVALEPEATYTIYVTGDTMDDSTHDGIETKYGVAMDGDAAQSFETYQSLCGLDEVDIADSTEDYTANVFSSTGEEHSFVATAYSYDTGSAQSITPMAAYDWEWSSWSSDGDGIDSEGAATDSEDTILTQTSETVGGVDQAEASYEAAGLTGEANIVVSATVVADESSEAFYCSYDSSETGCTADSDCQETCSSGVCSVSGDSCSADSDCEYADAECSATSVSGSEDVSVIVCENPWPALDYFPFEDTSDGVYSGVFTSARLGRGWMNFSTYYCRDAGEDNDTDDDYPELRVILAQEQGTDEVLKEYFLNVVEDGSRTGDAIGIRYAMNSSYLSPTAWYEQSGFTGSPEETTVDGFPAITDGRSTYIAVPNYVTGTLYPNIMIISYNYGASSTTVDIYDMLIENLSLVINVDDTALCYTRATGIYSDDSCESDFDCTDAGSGCADVKSKLMRDMQRLGDITDLAAEMTSSTPQIESGSYVRSLSSSVWSSWDGVLAADLETSVGSDPLNTYARCGSGRFSDYDSETCVDDSTGQYVCPMGSYTYHYQAYGDSGYILGAELEYRGGSWYSDIDDDLTDDAFIKIGARGAGDGFENGPAFCDGTTVWGSSDACGDGIVGSGEVCEIGDTSYGDACTTDEGVAGNYITECNSSCSAYEEPDDPTCSATSCGNGVVEDGEDCDDGSLNGSYGFCGADCTNSARAYCGDGTLAGGEVCDCGSTGTASGAAYGGGSCTVLNGVYSASASDTCSWDCSGAGPYCGDSTVDDDEECDGDTETYSGTLCSSGVSTDMTCEEDEDCVLFVADGSTSSSVGRCGETDEDDESKDTANECPYTTVCVGGDADKTGEPCDSDGDCDSSDGGDGICSSTEYQTTRTRTCNDSDCTWEYDWDDIDCLAPGSCGDGVVDEGEECDDGNDDSTDECTVECTENVCGDGYVYADEEQCDEGDDNGEICTSAYGSTCTYCSDSCLNVTSSGSFCGDGVMDADEVCDADDVSYYYFDSTEGVNGYCDPDEDTTMEDDDGVTYTCTQVGICNGGSDNADYCSSDSDCSEGDCVMPVCSDSCASMCPFTYTSQAIAIKTNELDASRQYSVDISPFDGMTSVLSTGNSSTMYIPACTVAETLTLSIDETNREYPDVEIMMVLDRSNSMANELGSSDRITILGEAVEEAIDELYAAYSGKDADMSIGWSYVSDTHYNVSSGTVGDTPKLVQGVTSDKDELLSSLSSELVSGSWDNGTPLYESIEDAVDGFTGTADIEYLIIFTDGNIWNGDYDRLDTTHFSDHWTDEDSDGEVDEEEYMVAISDLVDDLKDDEVKIFTAVFTETTCDEQQMARWSSMSCEASSGSCSDQRAEGNYECSNPDDGITYAYEATTSEELTEMYEEIVDAILNVTISLTFDGETISTTVEGGNNREIELPTTFICDEYNEQSITTRTAFNGSGSVEFSDIYLNMCTE